MKKFVLIHILILGCSAPAFSEGFYIDGGVSVNMSNYGTLMDEFISNYFEFYGLSRFVFGGNVSAGYRLIPGLYIGGSFIYTRDMLRGFGYNINLYSPSLLGGIRWYPLKSKRFLQLGLDAGPSWLIFVTDIPANDSRSGIGFGINATVACDFNTTLNGPHWQLAMNVLYANINGGSVLTPGISLKVGYWKTKNVVPEDFDMKDASITAGIVWPLLGLAATWIGYKLIPPSPGL